MRSICYILSTLERTGPTNQLYDVLQNLDRTRFEPSIVTLSPEPERSALPEFTDLDVDVDTLGLSRLGGFLKGWSALRDAVSARGPDLVHTHGFRPDVFSSVALDGYPRIATIHNYPYDDYRMRYGTKIGIPMAWTHLRCLSRIEHPVACSARIGRSGGLGTIANHTIRNGVDTDRYSPAPPRRTEALRRSLGLPETATIFVSVGPLLPRKNPTTVIRGFLRSETRANGAAHLVVVGDGPRRDRCEELASGSGHVTLPGRVPRIEPYLESADYFVSASKAEGLPLAVLEALSTGLGVCLSEIPSHREILELDGRIGVSFDPAHDASLAARIDSLNESDGTDMSSAARELAVTELSAERMAREYQELYDGVLARWAGRSGSR